MSENSTSDLAPLVRQLVALVGRLADDPELIAYVTEVLGQKMPTSVTDTNDTKYVVAKKHGLDMLFGHDVKNEQYPLIPRSKKSYVPYLRLIWLKEKFPDPLPFGIAHGMAPDDITNRLGVPPGERGTGKIRFWKKPLDPPRDIVLNVTDREITIGIDEARELASRHHPSKQIVGLFLAWAVQRKLLDESQFVDHSELLAAVRNREKRGSDLLTEAVPRGIWDIHLKQDPDLRNFAYGWFHNIDHGYIVFDLIEVFGARDGPHGHKEPILDEDDWSAVDRATKMIDERFARWVKG